MVKSILFIGDLNSYSRSLQRYKTLKDLGINSIGLSFENKDFCPGISEGPGLWCKIRYRLGYPIDDTNINQRMLAEFRENKPQCLWIEKALMVRPSTLKKIREMEPDIKIVFFSEDDMFGKHNQSKYFLSCLPQYDVVFTTKSYNINANELPSLGAKKVLYVEKSFDPNILQPITISDSDKPHLQSDVSFIGTFESDRKEKLLFLAKSGVKVRVWGNGWSKYVGHHPNLQIENIPVYEQEYIKRICASKINLCFLRKINRDLHTDRSVEIPACGGFMLAENSTEHQKLFKENVEAAFFDNNDPNDLLEKVQYFLEHDEERMTIAKAGRERCQKSGYSHKDRLTWMLQQI